MATQLIARGQATIISQKDSYTITQSVEKYTFPALNNGTISETVSFTSTVKVTLGDQNITDFIIGTIAKTTGFSTITINNSNKTITYSVTAGTTNLADSGAIIIPIIIASVTYQLSFSWSKAKTGATGPAGIDANMLDWVQNWNNNKTTIGANSVITPKLFAGIKNPNGSITGTAIGHFSLNTLTASGEVVSETINGVYGFKDGYKTFSLDNTGTIQLGNGNQLIRYNASTGKIEFGSEVTLNWINAINTAKTETLNQATITAQNKADTAKNAAISAAATDTKNKISALKFGVRNYIRNSNFNEALIGVTAEGTTVSIDDTTLYTNYKTLKVVQSTACTDANAATQRTYFTAINSKICSPGSFSMYVKGSVAGNIKIRIGGTGIQTKAVTTTWERITIENIIPTSAVVLFGFQTPGTYWCALPILVEGTKAVDWNLAPEDINSRISDAKTTGTNAKAVADAITNKAAKEGWSSKLTYINSTGIFTGTLSANTINAIQINGAQITAGTINAARIDVASLKALLITAGNIEALTLNVLKGKVGCWNIDSDSLYSGTKNNTLGAYTAAAGSITIGSNGLRGFKWELDNTGAGALAGGNISWDSTGNVTFGSSVTVQWTSPIQVITTALGGSTYPKLTKISSEGIYTGTLSAAQVNAVSIDAGSIKTGTLIADRIATNSLSGNKIISRSITADRIATGSITANEINVNSIQASIVTAGAVNGLTCTFVRGSIAGWTITSTQIYKNNVYLNSDGSLINGNRWKFNNDGSGQIANGAIVWNSAGTVSFSQAVSLNWINVIDALSIGGSNLLNNSSDWRTAGWNNGYTSNGGGYTIDSSVTFNGKPTLKTDVGNGLVHSTWVSLETNVEYTYSAMVRCNKTVTGNGSTPLHYWSGLNNQNQGKLTVIKYDTSVTANTWKRIYVTFKLTDDGNSFRPFFYRGSNESTFYQIAYLKLERGNKPTDWCQSVSDANKLSADAQNTANGVVTALGGGSYPKLTKIDSNGIYTGTLTAGQITAGTLNADRIAAGSINSSKLDANSIKANIINVSYINGLSCTFVRGTIGGFSIGDDNMSVGTIGGVGATPLQIRSKATGSGYWYNGAYKPFGVILTWHQNANAGHLVLGQIAASGNTVRSGFIGLQMLAWDNTEYFCLSANYTKSGSKEIYNRIAGWAFDNTRIWKNSVSLGSDGSIYNGDKWRLNNDGSGKLANGAIVWNASGTITFSSTVAANWSNAANNGKLYARGTGLNHTANRIVMLNGNQVVSSNSRGITLTVINRSNLTVVSSTNYDVYSNDTNCNSLASALNALGADKIVILTSYDAISINSTLNTAIQRCGGSNVTIGSDRCPYTLIGIPTVGKDNGLVSLYENAASEPYAEISTLIINGIPLGVNVTGKQKTYIDGNGIYTGNLNASQINAGTINTERIAAGSINSSKLDAASIKANIINTSYINGLACTFSKGTIGGWSIASSSITKNSVSLGSDGTISNGTYWSLKSDGSSIFGIGKIAFNYDGSGFLANQNISWDAAGNVQAKNAIFNNVRIQGSVRNKFVLNDSSIWIGGDSSSQENFNNYDNIVAVRGSWDEDITLPWSLEQSGRRVTLVNYKWRNNTTAGYMSITAPSGKYFYEDGISKSSLRFSRELLELLGYGDDQNFFGWIVLNRRDIMTASKYGSFQLVLAQGIVSLSGTSVSVKSNTFDGKSVSVGRSGEGRYTVYLPWSLDSKYFVQATGYYTTTPIYVTITGIYSSYFTIQTQDDSTANDGSFNFQVFSTASWGQ